MVEQSQSALKKQTVLATAKLLGDDDAGMGSAGRLPLLVKRGEIADVVGENRSTFRGGEGKLLLVRSRVFLRLLSGQDIETAPAQISGQPGHDMPVEVE